MAGRTWIRIGGIAAGALGATTAAVFYLAGLPALHVATSYTAKVNGSALFVGRRSPDTVFGQETGFLNFVHTDIQNDGVVTSVFGLAREHAVFRPGIGVTLDHGRVELPHTAPVEPVFPAGWGARPWPLGAATEPLPEDWGIDAAALTAAIDYAFSEPGPEPWRTRAVVVVQHGRLLAERYADGFSVETRLAGWSMTKSIINALTGILVRQGQLDIHAPAPVPEWADAADLRHAITTDQLLRMSSGLAFAEEYFNPFSDATQMLFIQPDAAAVAAAQPLAHEPDKVWSYSSGTTNILSRIVRQTVGDADYWDFPRRELFEKIGMYSALIEPDPSGTLVGSSFGWATARDWARFGQLFLQDGVWEGERILPEAWVAYSTTPTPPAPKGGYGAQWWLNAGTPEHPEDRPMPTLPPDLYFASGFEGQRVYVAPSHDAVIVRLGLTQGEELFDFEGFARRVLSSLAEV
ncbi:MAG: serine hydrolase [Candidatus Hydrogenedens sp.]|nr:serine hydrolase [Candidatus Hydrogenedens sp.]